MRFGLFVMPSSALFVLNAQALNSVFERSGYQFASNQVYADCVNLSAVENASKKLEPGSDSIRIDWALGFSSGR
jgi:hypothetical protein